MTEIISVEPTIYSVDEHKIDKKLIDKDALYVIEKLQEHGFVAYLVGGGVRDLLANLSPKDFDLSTSAKPEEVKRLFGRQCLIIGRRFRLAHIRFGKKVIEVATFRSFQEQEEGALILNDNVFGTPEEDARRRDFTINGLFYDPHNETVIDYVGGFHDLKKGLLATIGDPLTRFKEDPVRMIRLLKFNARFNYTIEERSNEALNSLKEEIIKSSQARILEELLRMLESGHASAFFKMMSEKGLLKPIAPLLAQFLASQESTAIFNYLESADKIQKKYGKDALDRHILASCLIYPILEKKVASLTSADEKPPHLGMVMLETHALIREVVTTSFSRFPRRLSTMMSLLLVNQWRLTPFGKRHYSSSRFLNSKDFPPALKFLKIRSLVDENLKETYTLWNDKFRSEVHHGERQPHPHHWQSSRSRSRKKRVR